MRIIEFRIFVPLQLPQCRTAAKYSVNKRTREETGGGDGFEIVDSGYFDEDGIRGRYVHRVLHFKNRVPGAIRWLIPDKYAHVHENNRNAFPHYTATFRDPPLGDKMILDTETRHFEYTKGMQIPENCMNFTPDELRIRKIRYLDVLNGPKSEKEKYDIHGFSCPEAGIQELVGPTGKSNDKEIPEWVEHYNGPITLIIKTVKFHLQFVGQNKIEKYVTKNVWYHVYLDTHRAMLKDAPDWVNFTEEDIARMEAATQNDLNSHEFDRGESDSSPRPKATPEPPKEEKEEVKEEPEEKEEKKEKKEHREHREHKKKGSKHSKGITSPTTEEEPEKPQ